MIWQFFCFKYNSTHFVKMQTTWKIVSDDIFYLYQYECKTIKVNLQMTKLELLLLSGFWYKLGHIYVLIIDYSNKVN